MSADSELKALLAASKVSISPVESAEDAAFRRRKDWVLFLCGLLVMGVITAAALMATFGPWSDAGQREVGRSVLALVIGAIGGFVVGRKSN